MKSHLHAFAALMLLLFCFLQPAAAAEIDVRFEAANQAYRASDFQKAAKLYEEIESQGYESSELYYNLGNCYYKLNKVPAAILQFERAKRLDPDDEDIAHNLGLANLRVVDRVDPIPQLFYVTWWRKWADLGSADRWAVLGISSLWLAILLGAALFLPYQSFVLRRVFSSLAMLALVFFLLSIAAAVDRHNREQNQRYAIVFAASTQARSAPDPQSTNLFMLHEGVKVELLDHVGGWSKIRLADGKIGWIESSAFQVI
jgi:tetratricopeptide (TPR) repeat protein